MASMSGITVVSFRSDGAYLINPCLDMNAADHFAEVFSSMSHYLNLDGKPWVTQWHGPSADQPRWSFVLDEEKVKTALLLLLLED